MWIVAVQRNYYPSVQEFQTLEEAMSCYAEECKELSNEGASRVKVYIAKVANEQI